VRLHAQGEKQNFIPLEMGRKCPEATPKAACGARVNRIGVAPRISIPHEAPGGKKSSLTEIKVLPLATAFIVVLAALGMDIFDSLLPVMNDTNPKEIETSIQGVNKSSITAIKPGISSSKMMFTRHNVGKGETISRIAHSYGLSPATIVSVNELDSMETLKKGHSLIIPYIDGRRIQGLENEDIKKIAGRFNTTVDEVYLIPGSEDYFIYGRISDEVLPSNTVRERFLYPVPGKILTAYGESMDELTGIGYTSEGIYISVRNGTPVNSTKEGRIILTGHHSAYGLYVIMSHAGEWKSFYGHLGSIQVAVGDELDAGELLGYSGATGTARAPQLLFVLISAGESVDPLDYLY